MFGQNAIAYLAGAGACRTIRVGDTLTVKRTLSDVFGSGKTINMEE